MRTMVKPPRPQRAPLVRLERLKIVLQPIEIPIVLPEPPPEPTPVSDRKPVDLPRMEEPIFTPDLKRRAIRERNSENWRYFWSTNAGRAVKSGHHEVQFTRVKNMGGTWTGYHKTKDRRDADTLAALAGNRSSCRELSAQEFAQLTGLPIEQPNWSVEDYMAEIPLLAAGKPVPKTRRAGRIIHCVQRWRPKTKDWERRIGNAFKSWVALYQTGEVLPAHLWEFPRTSQSLGDSRRLPYLRDVLKAGLDRSQKADDVIMLTNDDSILHPALAGVVFDYLTRVPAVTSGRITFERDEAPDFTHLPPKNISWGNDIGRDLFAFRKPWLKAHWSDIPDLLIGEIEFDLALGCLFRKWAGAEVSVKARNRREPLCELPAGYVWHENHERVWLRPENETNPARDYSRRVAREWYNAHGMAELCTC